MSIDTTVQNDAPAADDNTIEGGVTVVKEIDHAQVILNPTQYAIELFKPFNDQLATEKRRARRVRYDITTPDGMIVAKELATTFVKIRTKAEKAKTEAKRPIDQAGKLILAQYATLEAAAKAEEKVHADAIEAERKRLADIEEANRKAEQARIEAIEARLVHIRGIPGRAQKADSVALQAQIDELLAKQLDPALYDEFLTQAAEAMMETTEQLRQLHTEALEREAEARRVAAQAAELERLKAEREAAEARRREEEAERERQADAERKKAADEKADLERQLAEMKAAMAALQPKPEPAPEAAPVVGVDLAEPKADQAVEHYTGMATAAGATPIEERKPINPQGQYYSTTTFRDDGKPILCNADGSRSVFCDLNDDNPLVFSYDEAADVLTVEGIKYAGDVFRQMGGMLEVGALFTLTARENGVLAIVRR